MRITRRILEESKEEEAGVQMQPMSKVEYRLGMNKSEYTMKMCL